MKIKEFISVTLLIAGTTIGAGMLAIPLVTASSGFLPAFVITFFVWLFMFLTGLLFLEATLWMPKDANVLSMTERFLGKKFKILSGGTFVFLYYCLMIAYYAAGAPLFASFIDAIFQITLKGWVIYAIFGVIFGAIVGVGIKFVDRVNYILMTALFISFFVLVGVGNKNVDFERFVYQNWKSVFFAAPVLFSSFGFHNVIPSLTFHFNRKPKLMRYSILVGTIIPFIIYLLWQYLIIGAVDKEVIDQTLKAGKPITEALQSITGIGWVKALGKIFALFAIITSILGVTFSVVDFLGDGLKMKRHGKDRFFLCLLTFVPPFILTALDPSIFVLAIGVAGGFGEAFLNGILPAMLVWKGRYKDKLKSSFSLFGGRITLSVILVIGFLVMVLESIHLVKQYLK
ncbi:MAG: Tyrosine-specific transport protein [Candidatus Anoxychlamydiales bacterium]|nr:Tyrosine-specific transport protein [Candidatus Anoxychlamydiales bacterium]